MEILIISLVCITAFIYVLFPVFRKSGPYYELEAENDRQTACRKIDETLAELDFDLKMQKISEQDYRELKERYQNEKKTLGFNASDNEEDEKGLSLEERLEKEIARKRKELK